MEQVHVALFTGASCVGKSTITRQLSANRGWPAFDNDVEICGRIFDLFNEPHLKNSLGDLPSWQHLRENYDFDRLYRVHHRDWFARNGMPTSFLAAGWMYCRREWREQTFRAFQQYSQHQFHFKLFILDLGHDEFFNRYLSAQQDRLSPSDPLFQKSRREQKTQSNIHYNDFLNTQLQIPDCREVDSTIVQTNDQLEEKIADFFACTSCPC